MAKKFCHNLFQLKPYFAWTIGRNSELHVFPDTHDQSPNALVDFNIHSEVIGDGGPDLREWMTFSK